MQHFTLKTFFASLFLLAVCCVSASTKRVNETIIPVGGVGSTYTTIQQAYNAGIPADISAAGAYIIELQSDYSPSTEVYPIVLGAKTGASATNSITIKPAAGVTKTLVCSNKAFPLTATCSLSAQTTLVVGPADAAAIEVGTFIQTPYFTTAVTAKTDNNLTIAKQTTPALNVSFNATALPVGAQTIVFDGAKYVTLDGVSRTGDTQLIIDNPNKAGAQSILIKNDASYNTIKNCTIKGASFVGSASLYGTNSINGTIMIYNGITTGCDNNLIEYCDILDGASVPATHVFLQGITTAPNDNNRISNCNLDNAFQTVASTSSMPSFIAVSTYNNNTEISNNRIYASKPISPVSNQTYFLINISASSGASTLVKDNVIGYTSKEATGVMTVPNTATSISLGGISIRTGTATIQNNTIGGLNLYCTYFNGIWMSSGTEAGCLITGNVIKDINTTTTSASLALSGIIYQSAVSATISKNSILNLTNINNATNSIALTKGIITGDAISTVTENVIYNLTSGGIASTAINQTIGIDAGKNVSLLNRNLIYNLNTLNNGTPTGLIYGIRTNGGNDTGLSITNNMIRVGTDVTNKAEINGLYINTSTGANNKFNVYHNSVFVGGTPSSNNGVSSFAFARKLTGNVGVIDVRNNIFSNQRAIAGTENHYAIALLAAADLTTCNYNLYQSNGNLGLINTDNKADLTAWKASFTATNETNSLSADPIFVAPTAATPDLHIDQTSPAVAAGTNLNDVVITDFDGDVRANYSTHKDIGADLVKDINTSIKETNADVNYSVQNKTLNVYHVAGQRVSIYSSQGQLIQTVMMSNDNYSIASLNTGCYIVTVGNARVKVIVK